MTLRWESVSASICGSRHRRRGQCNQDAVAIVSDPGGVVMVVADGCGSGPRSHVGAHLGAGLLAGSLVRLADCVEVGCEASARSVARTATTEVAAQIERIVHGLEGERFDVVRESFLFTLVAAVLRPSGALVFAIGDGMVSIDNQAIELGPFDDNRPPYLGYELVGEHQEAEIVWNGPARRVALATDGVRSTVELLRLSTDPRWFAAQHLLERHLSAVQRERVRVNWEEQIVDHAYGVFADDVTIAVARRWGERG